MTSRNQASPVRPAREALKGLHFFTRFAYSFSALGYRQRRLCWGDNRWRFDDQRWLVSGASGGIGKAVATGAAQRGAQVLGVARSADKLAALADTSERMDVLACDLSLVAEIVSMVDRLERSLAGNTIDVLVNNVGVLLNQWQQTPEDHEVSFATNLLGHFALTSTLIERGLLSDNAVIINMTSGGMYNVPLSIAELDIRDARQHDGVLAYAYQKRAQVELNRWWRRHYRATDMAFYVMHPGWVDTEGVKSSLPGFRKLFAHILRDADAGADTALWLAAQRPEQDSDAAVWFDRKPRPAHISRATRRSDDDGDSLVAFLEDSLDT